jgi:hypothetical protein
MPANNFNVGRDCTVVLIAPTGARTDLEIVSGFEAKQDTTKVRIRPLNGPPLGADLPNGWNGSFDIERGNSNADDLIWQIESGYWNVGTIGVGQVYQYIAEVNGSTSTYEFTNVTLSLDDSGSYKGDASVKQKISFFASQRNRL